MTRSTLADDLAAGWRLYHRGDFSGAGQVFARILETDPENVEAARAHGVICLKLGKLGDAESSFRRALRVDPSHVEVNCNLGTVLAMQGRQEEAVERFRKAIADCPDSADAHYNLGHALRELGRWDESIESFRRAIRSRPDHAEAPYSLGYLLAERGELDAAVDVLRDSLRLRPGDARTHLLLGGTLSKVGRFDEALTCSEAALRIDPNLAEAHNGVGLALAGQGRFDEAAVCFRRALQLKPDHPGFLNNLGNALRELDSYDEMLATYGRVLRLNPGYAEAFNNQGIALVGLGRFEEAIASYEQAIRLEPDHAGAHLNRSLAWLTQGDFERGWPEYEWRWRTKGEGPARPRPRWAGEPLSGRTILLEAEQGLGDTIQYIRYAPQVKDRGGRVIVKCQKPLSTLLRGAAGIDQLVSDDEDLPEFDVHALMMSLPALLGTTLETIPAPIPYLAVDPTLVGRWRHRLSSLRGFRVGIAWQGNPKYSKDRRRSFPLAQFEPLARIEGVQLISLQKGSVAEQLAPIAGRFAVHELGSDFDQTSGPFMDTAAVMMNLDLVVTADTALGHLAGALGVRTWVALAFSADYRWMMDRADSPWYPTLRLFRQSSPGRWEPVFAGMAEALRELVGGVRRGRPIAVEISPGELIDKITILEIKAERIGDPDKLRNIHGELALLAAARDESIPRSPELATLTEELKAINEALWQVEDDIRRCERIGDFGAQFTELARSVYRRNDRRGQVKRQINDLLGSLLIEEKSYEPYPGSPENS